MASETSKTGEKSGSAMGDPEIAVDTIGYDTTDADPTHIEQSTSSILGRWSVKLEELAGLETRGIERVPDSARRATATVRDYRDMFMMWFGINCTANGINIGILGPAVYGLGFADSMLLCTFGTLAGSMCAGYTATFGPESGCRTMVISRFAMGWWPSRLAVLLNLFIGLGYGVVNCLTAGLILSAVNGGGMTPIVGIVVSALITWVVATFGFRWFRNYERYCWIPQVFMFLLVIGCSGPDWAAGSVSPLKGQVLSGSQLSYFFVCMSAPLSWASYSADYYVYLPKSTSKLLLASVTTCGIWIAKLVVLYIGVGLGSGVSTVPAWAAAYESSAGALIVESVAPLGRFGKFCGVIMSLGLVANQIPGAYSCSFNFQLLGSPLARVPRWAWSTVSVIIYGVCAIAGRAYLLDIFHNFLALIGYWCMIWVVLIAEEHLLFTMRRGADWDAWNSKGRLPVGLAALAAFCIGWVGAVLSMYEVYFTGPIAAEVGQGADMGLPVGAAWTAISFPPLRYLELKMLKR